MDRDVGGALMIAGADLSASGCLTYTENKQKNEAASAHAN